MKLEIVPGESDFTIYLGHSYFCLHFLVCTHKSLNHIDLNFSISIKYYCTLPPGLGQFKLPDLIYRKSCVKEDWKT